MKFPYCWVAQGSTLVTTDLDLYLAVQQLGYDAANFNHVRAGAWG